MLVSLEISSDHEETSITEVKSSEKYFLRVSTQKLCSRGDQRCHADSQTWNCVRFPCDTGFADMKESWRAAEACHCEMPGEATGGGATLIPVKIPRLRFGTMWQG